jgi:hypothetical protein
VVTLIACQPGQQPEVVGKTEVIKNELSPNWVKVFMLDYELGSMTKLAVSIFDEVRKGENISMGSCIFDVAEVLGSRGGTKAKRVKGGGSVYMCARKAVGSGVLRLKMAGKKLKNVEGMFSKSDPFFEVSRRLDAAGGQTWDNVFRSEWCKDNLNPEWQEAAIELSILCDGDLNKPIIISVFDHESKGDHTPMGQLETSVNGLKAAAQNRTLLQLKCKGNDSGEIIIQKADVCGIEEVTQKMQSASISAPAPTQGVFKPAASGSSASKATGRGGDMFLEYVAGGCELNVAVAIDFTGSNGDPRKPGTLHYMGAGQPNDYEKAISAIVTILGKYDSDKQYPVWGFGAKFGGEIQHCFECGGADKHHGVQGILSAYKSVFNSGLIMSGPTLFEDVITAAGSVALRAQQAAQNKGQQSYTVLLILTDGAVSDVPGTVRALESVSSMPLSIVIVGVGNADFSSMKFLDSFAGSGKRDIVQFVEFNCFGNDSHVLTNETLNEIPSQVTGYFQSVGIQPNPPIQRADDSILVEEEEEIDLTLDIGDEEIVVRSGGNNYVNGFAPYV